MSDLEFVRSYLAKHVELLGDKVNNTKTSIQMKFAHLGMIDEIAMGPDRWFTDEEMGKGKKLPGKTTRLTGGLNKDPVTIFVYAFVRDNLELFRKPDGPQSTTSPSRPAD